ncbi:Ltp family lipoprotein [Glaciibacter flavus]|uniref:Ltp family lipoprotein n=1 Tax=Orlajensenia flava TaxID=2565934 RepID=UPI003B009538
MSNETPQYKPGDIANGHYLGNDNQWHPVVGAPAAVKAERPPRKWFTKKRFIIPAAVIAVLILAIALTPKKNSDVADASTTTTPAATSKAAEPAPVKVTVPDVAGRSTADATAALSALGLSVTKAEDGTVTGTIPAAGTTLNMGATVGLSVQPKPKLTLAQQNAVDKAKSYLDFTSFSRSGLIGQLQYDGFSPEDATFGVDTIAPDWNAQAAAKAADYLKMTSFSSSALHDQLVYDGFSDAEANAGLAAVGY